MNNIPRRTGGVLVLIVSALVLLSTVAGVIGLWIATGQAHDLVTAVFSPLDSGLNTANEALDRVNMHVNNARARVSNAQEFVGQLGQDPVGNGAVLGAISNTVLAKLGPEIDQARESVSNTLSLVNGVNKTIVAVNKLPGVNLPTLTDEVQAVQARMTTLGDRMQNLRSDLEAAVQGRLQITGSRLNSLLAAVDSGLQNLQSVVDQYVARVGQAQAKVTGLNSDIASWITITWVIATIYLLWIATSQVVMIVIGWSLFRSKPKDLAAPAAPAAPTAPTGEDLTSTTS
jgi:hypothetical protein